jgi:hypothetical protein
MGVLAFGASTVFLGVFAFLVIVIVSGELAWPVDEVEVVITFLGVLLTLVFFTFFTLDPLTPATFAPFLGVLPKFFMTTSDHSVAFFTDFGTFGVFPIVLGVLSPNTFFPPVLGVFNAGVARTPFLGLVLLALGESSTSSLGVESFGVDPLTGVVTIGLNAKG